MMFDGTAKSDLERTAQQWKGWSVEGVLRKAIAYIEQLETQVPKWISVEERLPRCGERVLILNDGSVGEAYLSISHKWVRQEFVWAAKVTHWMYMPEPPKECE